MDGQPSTSSKGLKRGKGHLKNLPKMRKLTVMFSMSSEKRKKEKTLAPKPNLQDTELADPVQADTSDNDIPETVALEEEVSAQKIQCSNKIIRDLQYEQICLLAKTRVTYLSTLETPVYLLTVLHSGHCRLRR